MSLYLQNQVEGWIWPVAMFAGPWLRASDPI